ncbi:hypothetical protein Pogu_ECE035 (plasmid) [Pyrobaculum oguniense TE7]|uniref:Uncharacterized protein n=1 Tax=Pyrobaculum oguniense (strain DSM 13380 / JCM 10595 / TE7) TaxID=698757 RepID=H6QE32_PYROT|nr:hypothetical protein Pogu_ECE035 [Pyrobaculum oguniense TE7]
MPHPKISKRNNADLSKVDLSQIENDIRDIERGIEYVKQRLPAGLREIFDNVSVDLKLLNDLKQKVAAEKAKRQQATQKQQPAR